MPILDNIMFTLSNIYATLHIYKNRQYKFYITKFKKIIAKKDIKKTIVNIKTELLEKNNNKIRNKIKTLYKTSKVLYTNSIKRIKINQ